jgi:hypothetical protein
MNRLYSLFARATAIFVCLLSCQTVTMGLDFADSAPAALTSYNAPAAPESVKSASAACEPSLGSCCPCRNWIVGVEAIWFRPDQHGTGLSCYNIVDGSGTLIEGASNADANLDGFYITPRLTLGFQGECWGVQARYWRMNEPRNVADISPISNVGFIADNIFLAETLDLEVTRLFCIRETEYCASFGVRYAQLDQSSCVMANDIFGDELLSGWARTRRNFGGTGLTGALVGKRPIGCKNFNLIYGLRASLVWDNGLSNEMQTYASALNMDGSSYANAPTYARTSANSSMFIGEFQVGGQWDFDLKCYCAKAFVRVAFEYQYWNDSCTGRTIGYSEASADGGQLWSTALASSGNARVDLYGLSIGTGLTW